MLVCSDCGSPFPQYASINFAALLCRECCLVHLSLGFHFSRIKSLSHEWRLGEYNLFVALRRQRANNIFDENVSKIRECSVPRDEFIRLKYIDKSFICPLNSTKYMVDPTTYLTNDTFRMIMMDMVSSNDLMGLFRLLNMTEGSALGDANEAIVVALENKNLITVELLLLFGAELINLPVTDFDVVRCVTEFYSENLHAFGYPRIKVNGSPSKLTEIGAKSLHKYAIMLNHSAERRRLKPYIETDCNVLREGDYLSNIYDRNCYETMCKMSDDGFSSLYLDFIKECRIRCESPPNSLRCLRYKIDIVLTRMRDVIAAKTLSYESIKEILGYTSLIAKSVPKKTAQIQELIDSISGDVNDPCVSSRIVANMKSLMRELTELVK